MTIAGIRSPQASRLPPSASAARPKRATGATMAGRIAKIGGIAMIAPITTAAGTAMIAAGIAITASVAGPNGGIVIASASAAERP